MSVSGLCGVCEADRAVAVCERCGTPACAEHYDRGTGYCSRCAREVRGGPPGGELP